MRKTMDAVQVPKQFPSLPAYLLLSGPAAPATWFLILFEGEGLRLRTLLSRLRLE